MPVWFVQTMLTSNKSITNITRLRWLLVMMDDDSLNRKEIWQICRLKVQGKHLFSQHVRLRKRTCWTFSILFWLCILSIVFVKSLLDILIKYGYNYMRYDVHRFSYNRNVEPLEKCSKYDSKSGNQDA